MRLLSIFTVYLVAGCASAATINGAKLYKRAETTPARVTGDAFKGGALSSLSQTATQQQLNHLGFSKKRNISDWIEYVSQMQNGQLNFQNPQQLVLNSPLTPLFSVVVFGLVMAILVPLCGCCFFCIRGCCNGCGGRKPSEDGYSRNHLITAFAIFVIVAVLNIAFSAANIQYSNTLSTVLKQYKVGIDQTFSDVAEFGYASINGIAQAPNVAEDAIIEIVLNVSSLDLPVQLDRTFGNVVEVLAEGLVQLGDDVRMTKSNFNSTAIIADGLIVTIESIPVTLQSIKNQLTSLTTITVVNQTYSLSSVFPDTSALDSVELPDLSSVPNMTDYVQQLDSIPDPAEFSSMLSDAYNSITNNLTNLVNRTIVDNMPDLGSSLSTSIQSANASFTSSVLSSMKSVQSQINLIFPDILKYDEYRAQGMMAFNLLIIVPIVISFAGPLLKNRLFMVPYPVAVVLISTWVWFFFLLIYFLSAPLAIICNSYDPIMNHDYSLSEFSGGLSLGNSTFASLNDFAVNPNAIIDSCLDGKKLFEVSVNSQGRTPLSTLTSLLNDNLYVIDQFLKRDQFDSLLNQLPDPASQIGNVKDSAFGSLNLTELELPILDVRVNLTSDIQNINNTVQVLTPADIDPDQGNVATRDARIASFNQAVRDASGNTAFAWNYTYIVQTYVITSRVFYAEDATGLPSLHPSHQNIYNLWVLNGADAVFPRCAFIYYGTLELIRVKGEVNDLCRSLQNLQDNQINKAMNDYERLRNSTYELINNVNTVFDTIDVLVADVGLFKNATSEFIDWTFLYAKSLVRSSFTTLTTRVLLENPEAKFGDCKALAQDVEFMVDGLCFGILDGLAGLWYTALLLGIFLIFGFITVIIAKKRVEYLQRLASFGKDELFTLGGHTEPNTKQIIKTTGANDDFGVVASAPIDSPSYEKGGYENHQDAYAPEVPQYSEGRPVSEHEGQYEYDRRE